MLSGTSSLIGLSSKKSVSRVAEMDGILLTDVERVMFAQMPRH